MSSPPPSTFRKSRRSNFSQSLAHARAAAVALAGFAVQAQIDRGRSSAASRASTGMCRAFHRFEDARISSAAADISIHRLDDLLFGGIGLLAEQGSGAENHAGGAVAALERALVKKCLLHGAELSVLLQAFDGYDLAPWPPTLPESGRSGSLRRPAERCRLRIGPRRSRTWSRSDSADCAGQKAEILQQEHSQKLSAIDIQNKFAHPNLRTRLCEFN